MRRLILYIIIILACLPVLIRAEEGIWPPAMLGLKISEMQKMGLKLNAEDIYSPDHPSLKDAIVQFGGGCTGVIVSSEGLVFTNHHCGIGSIQRQSSLEHDYLTNGFWAHSKAEELPNPGLTVTLLIRMEDVTGRVLEGINSSMNEQDRNRAIKTNCEKIEKEAIKSTSFEAKIKSFYYGNQYFLFITEVFRDIRLVGAPPADIGNFGGDTDNWIWPRHTGDFSVFRIYASRENKPADYSKENVPYKPKKFISVSTAGMQKEDFTMVFGFPGTTKEYLTSSGVELQAKYENPLKIKIRQKRLDIITASMNSDARTRIQYASKHAGIANGWKKMIGESRGGDRLNTIDRKHELERGFIVWAKADPERNIKCGQLPDVFEQTYQKMRPYDLSSIYIIEGFQSIELLKFAGSFREMAGLADKTTSDADALNKVLDRMKVAARLFYRDYEVNIDREIAATIFKLISDEMDPGFKPQAFREIENKYPGDLDKYVAKLFSASVFTDSTRLFEILDNPGKKNLVKLKNDAAYRMMESCTEMMENQITPVLSSSNRKLDSLQRIYLAGLMQYENSKTFYPDANLTMRISYGKVDDYRPADAVTCDWFSTTKGILQKEDPEVHDYIVEPGLKTLINNHDYGRYSDKDGSMHVAFIASNHTSGGNSGSPVLDAKGRLIGLNFDRNWEGTVSDLQYDPEICRNIILDIRYCFFIIDRFAGAGRLIDEMNLVND